MNASNARHMDDLKIRFAKITHEYNATLENLSKER